MHEYERGRAASEKPLETYTFSMCGRTGWSLDHERSASGKCGERGILFEPREEGATA